MTVEDQLVRTSVRQSPTVMNARSYVVGPRKSSGRSANRHYLAVVAAEARRLGRQLRPAAPVPQRPPHD